MDQIPDVTVPQGFRLQMDAEAILCSLADNVVNFSLEGQGKIGAVGNGNPLSTEPYCCRYPKGFSCMVYAHCKVSGRSGRGNADQSFFRGIKRFGDCGDLRVNALLRVEDGNGKRGAIRLLKFERADQSSDRNLLLYRFPSPVNRRIRLKERQKAESVSP